MAVNRGKQFEEDIEKAFGKISSFTLDRLPDPMNGYLGQRNICDYFGYMYPNAYYIECKSVHKNTLSIHSNDPDKKYGMITNNQWEGLLEKSKNEGVIAGYLIWFIDHDVTIWVSAKDLEAYKIVNDAKSINVNQLDKINHIVIDGTKKRVRFDYDLTHFIEEVRG